MRLERLRLARTLSFLGMAMVLSSCMAEAAPPTLGEVRADFSPVDHQLVFSDEFDGSALDRGKWCTRYIFGAGPALQVDDEQCRKAGKGTLDFFNDEKQRYRDLNSLGEPLHVVANGTLTLRATATGKDAAGPYESAMIRSKFEIKPSPQRSLYVTARLKMPNVQGTWPAFWMISGLDPQGTPPWPPEITIVDAALNVKDDKHNMIGQGAVVKAAQTRTGEREMTYSRPGYARRWGMLTVDRTLRDVWIEAAVWWTHERLCFFLDGVHTVCENYRWVKNDGNPAPPAHVMVNLAIGGHWAGRHGIDASGFPTQLEVDHVRVYAGPSRGASAATPAPAASAPAASRP
jgi:beta-glucanase (GH16 family)